MPPSHVTKKSTTKESGVQEGPHPHRESRHKRTAEVNEEAIDVASDSDIPKSQGSEDLDTLLKSIAEAQRSRRTAKRTKILTTYASSLAATRESITCYFDALEQENARIRATHLNRLSNLLHHKSLVEKKMRECATELDDMYLAHSQDLVLVLRARAEALYPISGGTMDG